MPTAQHGGHTHAAPNLPPAAHAAPLSSMSTSTYTFYVTTTTDSTSCPDASGNISLRCAIEGADGSPPAYHKVIDFAISSSDPGCGNQIINSTSAEVCTIKITSDLPAISTSFATVNGYTQSGAHANTSSVADNAILTVQVDGSNYTSSSSSPAFDLAGNGDLVEGVSVIDFHSSSQFGDGIVMSGNGDKATGNFVGVATRGVTAGNDDGVSTYPSGVTTGDVIGGTTAATRNVMSANGFEGAYIASNGNAVEGNLVGTDPTGTTPMANSVGGELSDSSNNMIGGTTASARNVVSGNSNDGVDVGGSTGNTIAGNYVGSDVTGIKAVGNQYGVYTFLSSSNTIGGSSVSARNVISGNQYGVYEDYGSSNPIANNYIGVGATKVSLPNSIIGIDISTSGVTVSGNVVADNGGSGVSIAGGTSNLISRNSMYANVGGGIILYGQSPCTNGPSTGNPNDYYPCPVITSATHGTTSSPGTVAGIALASTTVEVFYTPSSTGDEGATYIGTTTADSTGHWSLAGAFTKGKMVTATSSGVGPSGGTSETSEFGASEAVR